MNKYKLICMGCGADNGLFYDWYSNGQKCCHCGSVYPSVEYESINGYESLFSRQRTNRKGIWRYFPVLPLLDESNQISAGELDVSIDRWFFLEELARENGVEIKVYAHRHDNNPATGTFKDLAGAAISSVLKEVGVQEYVVATTGNIGVALSRYLAAAGITLHVFMPDTSSRLHSSEISCFGQNVFRVKGDYARAKELATEFALTHGLHLSPNGFDPIRLEAKKTMALDWYEKMNDFPTVYIQGLSGGTGPLGIAKGVGELISAGLVETAPRQILVQSRNCNPMELAWMNAKKNNFSEGWDVSYPVINAPNAKVQTLATGDPILWPFVSKVVRESNGEIISFHEEKIEAVARFVAFHQAVRIGPAAAVAVGGYIEALKKGYLKNGDRVMIAIGEGIRRAPEFLEGLAYTSSDVANVGDCRRRNRDYWMKSIQEFLS